MREWLRTLLLGVLAYTAPSAFLRLATRWFPDRMTEGSPEQGVHLIRRRFRRAFWLVTVTVATISLLLWVGGVPVFSAAYLTRAGAATVALVATLGRGGFGITTWKQSSMVERVDASMYTVGQIGATALLLLALGLPSIVGADPTHSAQVGLPETAEPSFPGVVSAGDALLLFYGVFWASALAATSKFQAFDTRWIGENCKSRAKRFIASVLVCNALPVLWLLLLHGRFTVNLSGWAISAAAVASLSVFSIPRLLHGVVGTGWRRTFYSDLDWASVLKKLPPDTDERESFWVHFGPGLGYLLASGIGAEILLSLAT
jgi:hypothetical protein